MLAAAELRAIAREVRTARQEARQIEPFSARYKGFYIASDYAVASLNHGARIAASAVPAGRKIGFTNPQMWKQYDVSEPAWGDIYDKTVVQLATARASCCLVSFTEPEPEAEIALHLARPPSPGCGTAPIPECIDWIAHAIGFAQSVELTALLQANPDLALPFGHGPGTGSIPACRA